MTLGDALGPGGKRPELYGIGGWLAFLCVTLLFFTPLGLLLEFVSTLAAQDVATVDKVFIIGMEILVGAFAVFAGVGLVRIWRNAVRVAKVYFFLSLALGALGAAGFFLDPAMTPQEAVSAARWLVGSALWLAYLYRSERVRNTYSNLHAQDAAEVFK